MTANGTVNVSVSATGIAKILSLIFLLITDGVSEEMKTKPLALKTPKSSARAITRRFR